MLANVLTLYYTYMYIKLLSVVDTIIEDSVTSIAENSFTRQKIFYSSSEKKFNNFIASTCAIDILLQQNEFPIKRMFYH